MNTKIVELPNNNINVWTDEPGKEFVGIKNLDGVCFCHCILDSNPIFVTVDPRYSQEEIAEKIRSFLAADIPDVFRE